MRRLFFIIFLLCLNQLANALQVKPVKDNQTIIAKISAKQLTRIFVLGDRVKSVRGIEGSYEITKDEAQGAIFVKPTLFYQTKPFNIFITTEQDHTYTLLLNPLNVPAENIAIKPLSPSKLIASRWEKNSDYEKTILNLMNEMVNEEHPEGYAVVQLGKIKPKKYLNGLTMQLLAIYRGNFLQGEIWILKNQGKNTIFIQPRQFYQEGTRAVSLESETLNCGEEVFLYRVMSHG